jgi:hypothetical protein
MKSSISWSLLPGSDLVISSHHVKAKALGEVMAHCIDQESGQGVSCLGEGIRNSKNLSRSWISPGTTRASRSNTRGVERLEFCHWR